MRTNVAVKPKPVFTHEGAKASHINAELELRRSVMACLLFESSFYESGISIADRIKSLVPKVDPIKVAGIAMEARSKMNLRHVPLLVVREMARLPEHKKYVADTLYQVVQRPDELAEFLSLYWADNNGKKTLSAQVKKGLAAAFTKFSPYSLAKYNRDAAVKLRDVLFLSHAKPKDEHQEAVFQKLVDNTLPVPDTWETELSAGGGENKTESWTRLLKENKLGAMALLRNLRNMQEANVDLDLIREALKNTKTERVLPYRFIAAAKHAPRLEPELETAMFKNLATAEKLPGTTVLLVDVSGSMDSALSNKSDLHRLEAANGLAMLLREISEKVSIWTFSEELVEIPARRGFALRDAINGSQPHSGTRLGMSVEALASQKDIKFDRMIVISDEQSSDEVPSLIGVKTYMINVAAYEHGVGYGAWTRVDGFSEAVVDYIREFEKAE